jgi:hypothetical protein
MANNPKKVKDPTEVALSAIQEALNISDTAVDTSRNSIGNDLAPPSTSTPPLCPIAACSEGRKLMVKSAQPTSQTAPKAVASG